MSNNILSNVFSFGWWPWLIAGLLLGMLLGWLFWGRKKHVGDLTIEGEGQLRAEADGLRARVNELEGESGDLKGKLAAAIAGTAGAAAGAATVAATAGDKDDDDETYALEWRNRYLAARVKYLEGRISDAPKPKKKAAPKKRVVKKIVKKKVVIKAAPKKAPAKKAAASAKKPAGLNAKYLADVRKFDPKASSVVINNIVKYCGIALRSRDASLVACSQEHERDTIAKGFATKKLGMTNGQLDAVKATCEEMKGTRFKNRVTFYYLMAKRVRKMKVFR